MCITRARSVARAGADYDERPVTPQQAREMRAMFNTSAAEAAALMAANALCEYLNRWNDAGPAEVARARSAVDDALALDPAFHLAHYARGFSAAQGGSTRTSWRRSTRRSGATPTLPGPTRNEAKRSSISARRRRRSSRSMRLSGATRPARYAAIFIGLKAAPISTSSNTPRRSTGLSGRSGTGRMSGTTAPILSARMRCPEIPAAAQRRAGSCARSMRDFPDIR